MRSPGGYLVKVVGSSSMTKHFQSSLDRCTKIMDNIARCRGVCDEDDGEIYWREGCERCVRRTMTPNTTPMIEPPAIIAFWCEYLVEQENDNV